MMALSCPCCGSLDISESETKDYVCDECGYDFDLTESEIIGVAAE